MLALNPIKGVQKRKTAVFRVKSHFTWRQLFYKVSFCENSQRQSCKAFTGLTLRAKMIGGATPSTWNFGWNWYRWSEIADFRSIFARSASAVTPSEKKVKLTLIGNPLRAFQWAQDEHRTLSLSPQRAKKCNVSKIWTISCDNSEMVRDRMSVTINH